MHCACGKNINEPRWNTRANDYESCSECLSGAKTYFKGLLPLSKREQYEATHGSFPQYLYEEGWLDFVPMSDVMAMDDEAVERGLD